MKDYESNSAGWGESAQSGKVILQVSI